MKQIKRTKAPKISFSIRRMATNPICGMMMIEKQMKADFARFLEQYCAILQFFLQQTNCKIGTVKLGDYRILVMTSCPKEGTFGT